MPVYRGMAICDNIAKMVILIKHFNDICSILKLENDLPAIVVHARALLHDII